MYKVIIVDDCHSDVEGIKKYVPWNDLNCTVIGTAKNGLEGYELAINLKPDIIITDMSMPIINGAEMTKRINQQIGDDVSYIYISCHQSFDYVQNAIKNSAYAYILKPIKIPELIEAINKITTQKSKVIAGAKLQAELYAQLMNNRDVLLERYLMDLLVGLESIYFGANFFDIDRTCRYSIAIVKTEYENNFYENDVNKIYMHRIYLKKLISDKFEKSYQIIFEQNKIVVLLPDIGKQKAELIFDGIQSEFSQNFDATFSAYITQEAYALESISEPFKNILNLINNSYFGHKEQILILDKVLLSSQLLSENFDSSTIYNDIMDTLNGVITTKDFTAKYFGNNVINAIHLKSLCYQIISIVNIYLLQQNKTLSDIFDNEISVWRKLANFNTIINASQWVSNILQSVNIFLNSNRAQDSEKGKIIVTNIKKYIDNNFSCSTALEDSAASQNISLNYANTIFKKYEKQTIFDYLVHKRFDEAKKLLFNTNLKVNEIASMVGYTSNTYFSTAFKKEVGKTPQSYRESRFKKTIEEK